MKQMFSILDIAYVYKNKPKTTSMDLAQWIGTNSKKKNHINQRR